MERAFGAGLNGAHGVSDFNERRSRRNSSALNFLIHLTFSLAVQIQPGLYGNL